MVVVRAAVVVVRVVMVRILVVVIAVGDGTGGGKNEAAALDALGADQAIGELADELGRASKEDHLEASARVQVDVRGRHHTVKVKVLELGQALGDPPGVVVVDQGN